MLTFDYPKYILEHKGYKATLILDTDEHKDDNDNIRYHIFLLSVECPSTNPNTKWNNEECAIFKYSWHKDWYHYERWYKSSKKEIKESFALRFWRGSKFEWSKTQSEMAINAIAITKTAIEKWDEKINHHKNTFAATVIALSDKSGEFD